MPPRFSSNYVEFLGIKKDAAGGCVLLNAWEMDYWAYSSMSFCRCSQRSIAAFSFFSNSS